MSIQLLPSPDVVSTTINELLKGRANNRGTLTLEDSATSTTVVDTRVSLSMMVILSPRTANAAAAMTDVYISAVTDGAFVLTHASDASTDRTFDYIFHG